MKISQIQTVFFDLSFVDLSKLLFAHFSFDDHNRSASENYNVDPLPESIKRKLQKNRPISGKTISDSLQFLEFLLKKRNEIRPSNRLFCKLRRIAVPRIRIAKFPQCLVAIQPYEFSYGGPKVRRHEREILPGLRNLLCADPS